MQFGQIQSGQVQSAQAQPGHPGLFIAGRPWLAFILAYAVLALIGFAGGALNDVSLRSSVFSTAAQLAPLVLVATLACAAPLLAPPGPRARATVVLIVVILVCILMAFVPDLRAVLPWSVALSAAIAMVFLLLSAPGYGRAIIAAAAFAPAAAYAAAVAALGYLYRTGFATDQLVLQLLVLVIVLALALAIMFMTHFASEAGAGQSGALASGHTVNRMIRDTVFLAVAGGLMLRFYVHDPVSLSTGLSLFAVGAGLVFFAALPVLVAGTVVATVLPIAPVLAQTGESAQSWSAWFFKRVLARTKPIVLASLFAAAVVMALIALIELPPAAVLVADAEKSLLLSALMRLAFYCLIFGLAAVIYGSLRVSVFVAALLALSDILSAGLMALLVSLGVDGPEPAVRQLADTGPRLIVLAVLIRLATDWRDVIAGREAPDVSQLLARRALTAIATMMTGVVLFAAAGLVLPSADGWAGYMTVKLLLQALIILGVIPLAMTVFTQLKL